MPDSSNTGFSFDNFTNLYGQSGFQNDPWMYAPEALAQQTGFSGSPTISNGISELYQGESSPFMGETYSLNPEFKSYLGDNFTFSPTMQDKNAAMSIYDKAGNVVNPSFRVSDHRGGMMDFMSKAMPALVTSGFGAGLGSLFGGGAFGNIAGNAASGAFNSAITGGNPVMGALQGGIGAGVNALNPAQFAGLSGDLGNLFNRGVSGASRALAGGASGGQALQAGLGSTITPGLNMLGGQAKDFMSGLWDDLSGDNQVSFEYPQAPNDLSLGDYARPEDVSFQFDQSLPSPELSQNMLEYNGQPSGFQLPEGMQGISSMSMPEFAQNAMNYAGNNLGDIATALYGFYNNRKQQKAISDQMNTMQNWYNKNSATNENAMKQLQDLYSQNSPYAQQLRNKITAQAAAQGRRSNLAGRETQLQAALADRYASILPQLTSMQNQQNSMGSALAQANLQAQQQRGLLQNRMMGNLLNMGNQMGVFKGLGSLFGVGNQYPYNNGNVSGSDVFGYKGAGGF